MNAVCVPDVGPYAAYDVKEIFDKQKKLVEDIARMMKGRRDAAT